jgi:hypothetical protein
VTRSLGFLDPSEGPHHLVVYQDTQGDAEDLTSPHSVAFHDTQGDYNTQGDVEDLFLPGDAEDLYFQNIDFTNPFRRNYIYQILMIAIITSSVNEKLRTTNSDQSLNSYQNYNI